MDEKGKGKMKELEEEDVRLLLQPTTAAAASSSNSTAASSSRGVPSMMMMMPHSTAASSSREVPSMMMPYAASGFYRPRPGGSTMRPIRMTQHQQQQLPLLAPAAAVARRGQPKTKLCRRFLPGFNQCRFGNQCYFAHGLNELRSISNDPTNFFKTKDCHTDAANGVPSTMMTYAASSSNSTDVPSMMMPYAASGPRPGGGSMRPIRMRPIRMTNHQEQLPLLAPTAVARRGQPKTQLCRRFLPGFNQCRFGNQCYFAHGLNELRSISNDPNFFKTKDCHTDAAGHEESQYGAHQLITDALHHATAALMQDALDATRRQEEEDDALLEDAVADYKEDEDFAAKSFSFTITKQD